MKKTIYAVALLACLGMTAVRWWDHPAIDIIDSIIKDADAGVAPEKIADRLRTELRPWVVDLAALDPRD